MKTYLTFFNARDGDRSYMKAAIIGVGAMGRRHISASRYAGLDVAGICDLSPQCLKLAEQEWGVPAARHYQNPVEMLSTVSPDVVIVSTTTPSHCELVCLAAEKGAKYILCEKPMASSLAECDRMIEVCKKHGTLLGINHQRRFAEQSQFIKRFVQEKRFGGIISMNVVAGNMGIAMNGSHFIEAFNFLTDEVPINVEAWLDNSDMPNPRGEQFRDAAGQLRMTTASGKRFYLDCGVAQGHGIFLTYSCKNGRIGFDEFSGKMTLVHRQQEYLDEPTSRYCCPWAEEVFKIKPLDIVESTGNLLKNMFMGADYPDAVCGRRVVAALVATWISHEEGRLVKIDDNLPLDRYFAWA